MNLFDRTLHPDEANQAFTVGRLLETGHYTYRPTDHHGPTLYYAAAPLQKVFGHTDTASLDATLLRCTPLVFGVLALVFLGHAVYRLVAGFSAEAGTRRLNAVLAALAAVALLGTAPLFVFFATDFIQETLLACFTAMMLWAGVGYFRARTVPARLKPGSWALLFGIGAGLSFATKETCALTFVAAGLASLPFVFNNSPTRSLQHASNHLVLAVLAFLLTATVLFSSFCQDWTGVYNAFVAAPLSYLHRAAGDAAAGGADWHVHPWWKYLQWLFTGVEPSFKSTRVLSDGAFANLHTLIHWFAILTPALFLSFRSDRTKHDGRLGRTFLGASLYFVLLLALYSAIPYKTPWCTVQILLGFVLSVSLGYALAADTIGDLVRRRSGQGSAVVAALVLLVAAPGISICTEHIPGLLRMSKDPDARAIPYNYAHASPEVKELAACVDAAMKTAGDKSFIAVALPPEDTWPFPWYNRPWESKSGYWTKFDDLVALEKTGAKPTVVIVPMREGHLVQPLFPHLKHTKRFYIRPGVRARVFW